VNHISLVAAAVGWAALLTGCWLGWRHALGFNILSNLAAAL
jgi:hypothetical protein